MLWRYAQFLPLFVLCLLGVAYADTLAVQVSLASKVSPSKAAVIVNELKQQNLLNAYSVSGNYNLGNLTVTLHNIPKPFPVYFGPSSSASCSGRSVDGRAYCGTSEEGGYVTMAHPFIVSCEEGTPTCARNQITLIPVDPHNARSKPKISITTTNSQGVKGSTRTYTCGTGEGDDNLRRNHPELSYEQTKSIYWIEAENRFGAIGNLECSFPGGPRTDQ